MNELLKKYKDILKLNDWEISLQEDDSISENASTLMIYNDYKAYIKIKSNMCYEQKEIALIHELVHLIFRDAYDIFSETVKDEFANKYCARQHERAIEKTAKVIYALVHPNSLQTKNDDVK